MKELTSQEIELFFEILHAQTPLPQTELIFTNAYTLLVAVILSAQSTDKGVNKATASLFQHVSTPQDMVTLGEEALRSMIQTIGLFNAKARNIIATSRLLIARHQGHVPHTRSELMALPGVGRKTANVILNVLYNEPVIAVDTHVFRVSNRTGLACGKTPLDVELKLEQRIPLAWRQHAHHWLILLGRHTCFARKPACHRCPVTSLCQYFSNTKSHTP